VVRQPTCRRRSVWHRSGPCPTNEHTQFGGRPPRLALPSARTTSRISQRFRKFGRLPATAAKLASCYGVATPVGAHDRPWRSPFDTQGRATGSRFGRVAGSSIGRQLLLSPHEALPSLAADVARGPSSQTGDERP
jgi:hypothetical protein